MRILRRLRNRKIRTFLVEALAVVALIAISEVVTQMAQRAQTPAAAPQEAAVTTPTNTSTPRPTAIRAAQPTPTSLLTPRPSATPVAEELTAMSREPEPFPTAVTGESGRVFLGDTLLLDLKADAPECARVGEISYSPTREHFLVILACQGWQDVAFLFQADGNDKQAVNGVWDYIKHFNYEWAPDGSSFVYERINACCLPPSAVPPDAPLPGLVEYNVADGEKRLVSKYRVVDVHRSDTLNVRAGPGVGNHIVGEIPYDGKDVVITGEAVRVGDSRWVPIRYRELLGWVNMNYIQPQVRP